MKTLRQKIIKTLNHYWEGEGEKGIKLEVPINIADQILELFTQEKQKWVGEIEKKIEPFVSKPDRQEDETLYQIKKTLCDEIWAKQKDKLKQLLKKG